MSNLVEFSPNLGNGHHRHSHDHDSETVSENSQTESFITESQQRLFFEKSKTRRISKISTNTNVKTANEFLNGDESSPLLSASCSAQKLESNSNGATQDSPLLEAKVNLSGNLFEYYLPKHGDEECYNGLHNNFKRKNILQYPKSVVSEEGKEMTKNHHSTSELSQKPMTLLTFNPNHRSSLNESADNFSLLTPSSSTSTTPIAALAKSASISDTNEQCSSSLSSGSNPSTESKISPIQNLYSNTQHLYANTEPNSLSSFGYGTVQNTNGGAKVNGNGRDTIVVSKSINGTNTKPLDSSDTQHQSKANKVDTQTTYV